MGAYPRYQGWNKCKMKKKKWGWTQNVTPTKSVKATIMAIDMGEGNSLIPKADVPLVPQVQMTPSIWEVTPPPPQPQDPNTALLAML